VTSNLTRSKALVLIITVGFLLRLCYALAVSDDHPAWIDSQHYLSIGHSIATNFQYANFWRASAGQQQFGDVGPTSAREPLYPLFLGLQFKLFGYSLRTVFVIQALVGVLTIPLCFGLGTNLFSSRVALVAALLESVNPYHIYYIGVVATETITSVLLLASVFFTLRICQAATKGQSISRGHVISLALLLSAGILHRTVFVPIVLITLIFIGVACYRWSAALAPAARTVGVLLLAIAACISPWFIRNYLLWHTFVYQTNAGATLLGGFNDLATGGQELTVPLNLEGVLMSQGYNEIDRDRRFRQEASGWILSHPARAAYLIGKKQLIFWSPVPANVKGYPKYLGTAWGFILLILTFIGLLSAQADRFALKYVLAVIVSYALVHSFSIAITRYRIPLEGILTVFAGYGVAFCLRASVLSRLSCRRQ